MQQAVFAVVGHPNKGKSSIVATLAFDDSVPISSHSGTTTQATSYRVTTRHSGYTLIDTPGFQRPRKVLRWLQRHAQSASERRQAVARFVRDVECRQLFPDETALLAPIMDGAAILYVVDGSRPYGVEYEAEMEILRWTGRPSMALINPIENESHVEAWTDALGQFFKTVRVFNPLLAEFERQAELMQTFAHLNPDWAGSLRQVIDDLQGRRAEQRRAGALILARLVDDICNYRFCQKVLDDRQAQSLRPVLEQRYQAWIRSREEQAVQELLANFSHARTPVQIEELNPPPDLFDLGEWYAWGLDRKQLLSAATMAGAVTGTAIDIALAGHSLMMGAVIGGAAGFGSALLGSDKLAELRFHGLPLGGTQACYGPARHANFPYVIIGRFLFLYRQISSRNHASRAALHAGTYELQEQIASLEKSQQRDLHQACARLARQKPVENLDRLLLNLL